MKKILKSGVTGILVSHSVPQVRSMCNKILWLDHGKQVGFTDQVELYCDAYEEFLHTKKLPGSEQEIKTLADDYKKRLEKAKLRNKQTETQRLEEILSRSDKKSAVKASFHTLQVLAPELLKDK